MRQLVYISTVVRGIGPAEVDAILSASRTNNTRDGVTGLLYFDGKRFLQALEGHAATIACTISRIEADVRHRAIVVLSDRIVDDREFGPWAMALQAPGADPGALFARIDTLCAKAAPSVRATFLGFAETRRAA